MHKEIFKYVFTGNEPFTIFDSGKTYGIRMAENNMPNVKINTVDSASNLTEAYLSNLVVNTQTSTNSSNNKFAFSKWNNVYFFYVGGNVSDNVNNLQQLMEGNTLYYPLETATNTEITDTTLISQLEAIYNAPLYEQTNITQTNNDLPMVLDITACKDNINGIKAFIRK